MINKRSLIIIFFTSQFLGGVLAIGIIEFRSNMQSPVVPFGSTQSQFVRDQGGAVVSGFSVGDGFTINWQSESDPHGAKPVEVISVSLERLRHLQQTNSGGNGIAQAIWNLEKSLESLQSPVPATGGGYVSPTGKMKNE